MTLVWDSTEAKTNPLGEVSFSDFGLEKKDVLLFISSYLALHKNEFPFKPTFVSVGIHFDTKFIHLTFSIMNPVVYSVYLVNLLQEIANALSIRHRQGFVVSLVTG